MRALKQAILDKAAGTSNGLKATDQQRKAISEAVNGLTARNPTEDVATSELATGAEERGTRVGGEEENGGEE